MKTKTQKSQARERLVKQVLQELDAFSGVFHRVILLYDKDKKENLLLWTHLLALRGNLFMLRNWVDLFR